VTVAAPPRVLAFLGKGGAGKTVLACLTGRLLAARARRVLLVDADPVGGLGAALGLDPATIGTVAATRERLVATARAGGPDAAPLPLRLTADYLLLEALVETHGFGFLAMGASREAGCYCAVTRLVRDGLATVAADFDHVIIDAEAGMEQVSRQLVRDVDLPLVVSDPSQRGAQAAAAIAATAARLGLPRPAGVIFNRVAAPAADVAARLEAAGLPCLGAIPVDDAVARLDAAGRPLLELPAAAPALRATAAVLARLGLTAGDRGGAPRP
jgi:CO dehydrogenase maturation factor